MPQRLVYSFPFYGYHPERVVPQALDKRVDVHSLVYPSNGLRLPRICMCVLFEDSDIKITQPAGPTRELDDGFLKTPGDASPNHSLGHLA